MKKTKTMLIIICVIISLTVNVLAYPHSNPLPPNTPSAPSGPGQITAGEEACFSTSATNPSGNSLSYMFDWGDGTTSTWMGAYLPGNTCTGCHTYNEEGDYGVRAKAKDVVTGLESGWSAPSPITVPASAPTDESCFLADTQVAVIDIETLEIIKKYIQDIIEGEHVISFNPDTSEIVIGTVTEIQHHTEDEMKDGYLIINDELRVTPNHPVLMDNSYIEASELKIGDSFLGSSIESITHVDSQENSYNLIVEPYHNYLVITSGPGIISDNNQLIIEGGIGGAIEISPILEPTIAPGSGLFGDKNNQVVQNTACTTDMTQTTTNTATSTTTTSTSTCTDVNENTMDPLYS